MPIVKFFVAQRRNMNLSPKLFGLFKIVDRVGVVIYKLELLVQSRVNNVFHISQLKKHVKNVTVLPMNFHKKLMRRWD